MKWETKKLNIQYLGNKLLILNQFCYDYTPDVCLNELWLDPTEAHRNVPTGYATTGAHSLAQFLRMGLWYISEEWAYIWDDKLMQWKQLKRFWNMCCITYRFKHIVLLLYRFLQVIWMHCITFNPSPFTAV